MSETTRLPSGRAIRRWTTRRLRLRAGAAREDLFHDLYIAALSFAVAVSMILAGARMVGADLAEPSGAGAPGAWPGLDPAWLVLLAAVSALAALTGLAARLGPVALGPDRALWWLSLPVDRRGLLRPAAVLWPAVAAVLGAVLGVAVALSGPGPSLVVVLASITAGGSVGVVAVCLLALAQTSPGAHRRARRGADAALVLAPPAGLALAFAGVPAPALSPAAALVCAVTGVAAAVALALALDRRLDELPDRSLRERGAVAEEALGATLSVDTRALGRALAAAEEPAERRSARMVLVRRVPRSLAPHAALVSADALLLRRSRRHLVQLLAAACLPALPLAVAEPVRGLVLLLLVPGAYLAALATAQGALRAEAAPALDALMPLSARMVRWLRLAVPTAAHLLWSLTVFALLAWRLGGDPVLWLGLGALAAPAWTAGAVRAAYRPAPDFSAGLVHTPMGSFSPEAAMAVLRGPDIAVLCAVPALIGVLAGTVAPALLAAQAVATAVALLVVTAGQRPRPSASASSA